MTILRANIAAKTNVLKQLLTIILLLLPLALLCQEGSGLESELFLSGAFSEEELDESVMEQFEHHRRHPLAINLSSRRELLASGLLSRYQVASLLDYKDRFGDILSISELALVDGFGQKSATALAPFISFRSISVPGTSAASDRRVTLDALARGSVKMPGGGTSAGLKLRGGLEKRLTGSFSIKPGGFSGNAAFYGRKMPVSVIVGDFNARFGQGLMMWNGFSLSGFSSASFLKNSVGVSPAWTFSPASCIRGAALEYAPGAWTLSAVLPFSGEGKALNVMHYSRRSDLGLTVSDRGLSADGRLSLGEVDLGGEVAFDIVHHRAAMLCALVFNPAYQKKASVLLRLYPDGYMPISSGAARSSSKASDEAGAALGFETERLLLTLDAALHPAAETSQLKLLSKYELVSRDSCLLSVRLASRLKPQDDAPWRTDLRLDGTFPLGALDCSLRANALWCKSLAMLGYAQCQYRTDLFTASLRATVFKVDNWDDRIYSYERDAPGNFTVPAYNGRGVSVSMYAGKKWKTKRFSTYALYLRASWIGYPWTRPAKPGKAELKLQLNVGI